MTEPSCIYRVVTYRLVPGSRKRADGLSRLAGACRYVWNEMLDQQEQLYTAARLVGGKAPSPSFFTLGQGFKQLRAVTPWLQELPFAPIRYALKYQADAWQAFFRGQKGHPRFKSRLGDDSVTIPQDVRLRDGKLHIPKLGWYELRRKGGNPYEGCQPVKATIKRCLGKWYATVVYAVEHTEPADNGLAIGVDMNVGQVAASTGDILHMPDMTRLEARKKRYQRMMSRRCKGSGRRGVARYRMAKTSRRIANVRHNWHHHVSRVLADTAGMVAIEGLKTKNMTASAKGTVENPGKNVKQKAGLNREILKTGWHQLRRMLEYKASQVIAVNPAYTSQTCYECGVTDAESRKTQARFECSHCGHHGNADVNAALNVMASGIGATGRRGAFALATPMNRQQVSADILAEVAA